MCRRLILSSGNEHKVYEIKKILSDLDIEIVTKKDLGLVNFYVEEDEDTLEGNAFKKAIELSKKVDGIVLADDTGLFVDALDGAPGVFSARFAGEKCSDEKNRQLLLEKLEDVSKEKRTAYFKTVIALVLEDGTKYKAEGICKGSIAFENSGQNGFGYDSLFIAKDTGKTFAQMTDEQKNTISHRANALKNLREILGEIVN